MKVEIKVPAMGESITQATIANLIKPSGSQVAADEEIIELETDKVNQVLYAPQAGVVNWNVKQDDVVKIGQVIGTVETGQAASAESSPQKAAPSKKETPVPKVELAQKPPESKPSAPTKAARGTKESYLSELTSSPQHQYPLPPSLTSTSSQPAASTQEPATPPGERRETRKKMSKIRKVIAKRLVEVFQQTAMLTTFNEVDMTHIIGMREAYKEAFAKKYNARLGYMSFFVKAAVSAMKEFPEFNAYIDGEELVYREYFDIGIAIGTDRGLIVPVVRDCDRLSFADIERSIETYAKQAREGGLSPDSLQGGGFTITNGGTYGSLLSTPIINPPQCAILGMHKIMKRPVVVDDQIVIRQMMYLALSYDHRIVDGKQAVSYLIHIKNCLEDPSRMVIDI